MNKRYGYIDLICWIMFSSITLGVFIACLALMPIGSFLNGLVTGVAFVIFWISLARPCFAWLNFTKIKRRVGYPKSTKDLSLIMTLLILFVSMGSMYLPVTFVSITGFSWILWEISLGVTLALHLER
ncbi:MAG: hypothetical protein A2320_05085 [Pseudomonadales bacterium GWC2_63_15]|nr:MAG: hypothetical protein A2320_05085 [Pseudomonadales bacterium GWC2_63_15]